MLTKDRLKAQNGILGLLLLGIIYQRNFKQRQDWMTLENLFSMRHLSSEFRKAGHIKDESMRIVFNDKPNQRIYDFLGAIGANRIQRKIEDDNIVFKQTEGSFDVANFYLYPHEIDFGPYRHMPPCIGQVFHPFEDYFEIQTHEVDFSNRTAALINPVILTGDTDYRLQKICLFFGEHFEIIRMYIDWHENLQTDIDISGQVLIVSYAQRGQHHQLKVNFSELATSLEEIGLALKVANDD
jgi:hypothetical protein